MARDPITVTTLTADTAITPPAAVVGVAANDLKITPANADDAIVVEVENTGASDHTVTFVTSASVYGVAVEDVAVVVTAGQRRLFKMLYLETLWIQADGDIYINIADDTDLSFWAYKV